MKKLIPVMVIVLVLAVGVWAVISAKTVYSDVARLERNIALAQQQVVQLEEELHDQISLKVDPKVVVTLSKSELVRPISQSDSWRWKGEGVIRINPDHPVKNIGVYLECKLFVNGIEPRKVQIVGKLEDGNEVSFFEEVYLEDGVVEGNVSLDVLHATWWPRYEFPVEVQEPK